MKKFILRLFIFLLLFVCIDRIYGWAMSQFRQTIHGGATAKTSYICDTMLEDAIILGSSRARMQYDPKIIADSLGESCYNCGTNGMGIIYDYGVMKIISRRYMPKTVIVDVLPILDIMTRDDNSIFINPLRPWYNVQGVDSLFWAVDNTERIKMHSGMYAYHSKFMEYISDRNAPNSRNGYEPAPATQTIGESEMHQTKPTDNIPDELKMFYLEKMIIDFKDKTSLVFVVSPRYNFCTSNTVNPLRRLCDKYKVCLLDHYADTNFVFHSSYFQDGNHMNITGAEIWSRTIAHEIKALKK